MVYLLIDKRTHTRKIKKSGVTSTTLAKIMIAFQASMISFLYVYIISSKNIQVNAIATAFNKTVRIYKITVHIAL